LTNFYKYLSKLFYKNEISENKEIIKEVKNEIINDVRKLQNEELLQKQE